MSLTHRLARLEEQAAAEARVPTPHPCEGLTYDQLLAMRPDELLCLYRQALNWPLVGGDPTRVSVLEDALELSRTLSMEEVLRLHAQMFDGAAD